MLDAWNELQEEQRPPREIWDKPKEITEWFDRVFSKGEKQTEFDIGLQDFEVEE